MAVGPFLPVQHSTQLTVSQSLSRATHLTEEHFCTISWSTAATFIARLRFETFEKVNWPVCYHSVSGALLIPSSKISVLSDADSFAAASFFEFAEYSVLLDEVVSDPGV